MTLRFLINGMTLTTGLFCGLFFAATLHTMNVVLGAFLGFAIGIAVMVAFSRGLDHFAESFELNSDRTTFTQKILIGAWTVLLLIQPFVAGVCALCGVAAFK
jgi:hypothetical protein